MVNQTKIGVFMLALASTAYATDYYIKNDLGQTANIRIACPDESKKSDVIPIDSGDVAYFKIAKCSKEPLITVTSVGNMPNSVLSKASLPLSKPFVRIYLNKQKKVAFDWLTAAPEDNIQNYSLDL